MSAPALVALCDYTTARSVRADVLITWLIEIGAVRPSQRAGRGWGVAPELRTDSGRWERAVFAWVSGERQLVGFYTVDALCCQLHRHVSELPPEAFTPHAVTTPRRLRGLELAA